MPIDESILRHDRKPEPPRRGRWWAPLLVAGIGTVVQLGVFFAARESPGLIKLFVFLTVLFGLGFGLALMLGGFQSDGLIGALYESRNPLGTVLGGDDPPSGGRLAAVWLLVLACILSGLLLARHPEAAPKDWLRRGPRVSEPGRWTR